MKFKRYYTAPEHKTPYDSMKFESRKSEIKNPDGSRVFLMENVMVPSTWSQVATDIIAQKYFRKAGVPAKLKRIAEKGVPKWLQRSEADAKALDALPEDQRFKMNQIPVKYLTDWLAAGLIGDGKIIISKRKTMRMYSMMSCATCLRIRWSRRIVHNGLILACTGHMELMVLLRDITM
jgi:hypothetical protein